MSAPVGASSPQIDRVLLAFAVVVFIGIGLASTGRMMVFSEELATLPSPAWRVVSARAAEDGRITYEPSCADPSGPRYILSSSRPTLALCVGGRSYPVMTAPQFSGLFLWPLELLRSFHRDNPFVVRQLLLSLGVLAIVLAWRLIALFGNRRLASLAAIAMAVSPCFVLLSSIIQHFETVPWIWLMVAMLVFAGCPQLAPVEGKPDPAGSEAPSTVRLVAGAFCVGLAVLANIKAVFLIVPFLALAARLRVRFGVIRRSQWILVLAAGLVALLPMAIPFLLDPSMGFATGRGSNWQRDLVSNLQRPTKVLEAVRDLLLVWSNFGFYLARDHVNPVSMVFAAGVFVFVCVDTVRTLARRSGCVVTAACGVSMFSYLGVVTLLYTEFPANFTPLYGIYGIAIGSATHRLASFLRARMPAVVAGALAAMLLVPFAWNTAQTMGSMSEIAFVTNSHAERDITRYLVDHPAPRSVPVTINLLAGGVVDALSGDTIHSIQAEEWLGPCERREAKDHLPDCLYDRFRAVLRTEAAAGAFRLILPVNYDLVHRPPELLTAQHTQFERAAHDEGLVFRLEQTFSTPKGTPAAQLFWIGPQGS